MLEDLKRLPVGFPADVHKALKRAAFEQDKSMSAIVVEAVRRELARMQAEHVPADSDTWPQVKPGPGGWPMPDSSKEQ